MIPQDTGASKQAGRAHLQTEADAAVNAAHLTLGNCPCTHTLVLTLTLTYLEAKGDFVDVRPLAILHHQLGEVGLVEGGHIKPLRAAQGQEVGQDGLVSPPVSEQHQAGQRSTQRRGGLWPAPHDKRQLREGHPLWKAGTAACGTPLLPKL